MDLLSGIDESALPKRIRDQLATLQHRVNAESVRLRTVKLRRAPQRDQVSKLAGVSEKVVLVDENSGQKYLFKKTLSHAYARKQQALSVMASLAGVSTPLAHPFRYRNQEGALIPWLDGVEQAAPSTGDLAKGSAAFDIKRTVPAVRELLLIMRWFDEVVANQDAWWGQFLKPTGEEITTSLVHVDFKRAWQRRDAAAVQKVLREHFGITAPRSQSAWTDRPLRLNEPVGWKPDQYDSHLSMYGPIVRAYVTGEIDISFDPVRAHLDLVRQIPRAAFENALAVYADADASPGNEGWGYVQVQAAGIFLRRDQFVRRAVNRIYQSIEPFGRFLSRLEKARNNPRSPIFRHATRQHKQRYN